jgi:hypothetical protein
MENETKPAEQQPITIPVEEYREFKMEEMFELSRMLECHHAVFYQLWELGKPRFSNLIPTAAVAFNPEGECIDFIINPKFWDGLTEQQKGFVVAHECLHVLCSHGLRAKDAKNREACNVAMDIVVNELLVSSFGFKRNEVDPPTAKAPDGILCWRDKVFKNKPLIEDEQTFEYYYNRLEIMPSMQGKLGKGQGQGQQGQGQGQQGQGQGQGQDQDQQGQGGQGLQGTSQNTGNGDGSAGNLADDHTFFDGVKLPKDVADMLEHNLSEAEKQELNKALGNHAADEKESKSLSGRGDQAGNMIRKMGEVKVKPKRKWETVITRWSIPFLRNEFKTSEHWLRTNRRMAMIDDAALLPTEMEDLNAMEKGRTNVWLFLDTSGSCAALADRFWKAGQSLDPKRFLVRWFCFDTKVYEVDPKVKKLFGFGGTSFDIIEMAIQSELKKLKDAGRRGRDTRYPDGVFILTDGEGNRVDPEKPERWHWFLAGSEYKQCIPAKCHIHPLSKFE